MTAPPTQLPLVDFAFTYRYPGARLNYLSPASAAADSAFSWTSKAPVQSPNRPPSKRKSMSPQPRPERESNGWLFITGNSPADFKSAKNMQKVRKQAMGSYLEKKPKEQDQRSRLKSVDSTDSRTSAASSEQQETISNSEAIRIWKGDRRRLARCPSSPIPSGGERQTISPEMQISRIPRSSVDFVLPSAPIVLPMRTGVELPYDKFTPRPFESIGQRLDPFRSMYQASHPGVSVEELKFYCSRSFGTRAMGQHWIPTVVKSPHAFLSTLCIASAHRDATNERLVESVPTLALRQEVTHLISRSLINPDSQVDDFNIIALTQLITSEIIVGEDKWLGYHEEGVKAMVKQRGGLGQLGVNGRLASTLSWVSLLSAIFREASPPSMYSQFCSTASSKNYPNTATVPESPLHCPRGEYETIKRSQRCCQRSIDLLKDIRMMMDLFLHETKQSRQNSLSLKNIYKKITTHYPSAAELHKTNVFTPNDWRYEAIRLTSVITATAIMQRTILSESLRHAADIEQPTSLYPSSPASKSSESLVSPADLRHDSPITSYSTSPCYSIASTFPQPSYFNFAPKRPSLPSVTSEIIFFPPPPPPTPAGSDALLRNLKTAIENSNLSDCWADMAGVLLWVGLTMGAASRKSDKVLRKWFRALAVRCSIVLCFEHPEAVHATVVRMGEMGDALASTGGQGGELRRGESSAGSGKRRRV